MQIELELLHILSTKSEYEKIKGVLKKTRLSPGGQRFIDSIKNYYEDSVATELDWNGSFKDYFFLVTCSGLPSIEVATYEGVFETMIKKIASSPEPESSILRALEERYIAADIAEKADKIFEGDTSVGIEDLKEVIDEFLSTETSLSVSYSVDSSIEDLYSEETLDTGYSWRLKTLNREIGKVTKGNTILIAARPEQGKTAFLISEVGYMAQQLTGTDKVLWFVNEEPGVNIKRRLISSILLQNMSWVKINPAKATLEYTDRLHGDPNRIIIWDQPRISMGEIVRLCHKIKPAILVCDQLRNVVGFDKGSATEVERLKKLFVEWRALAKEFGPAFTVHQARGDAENVLYPNQNQLEGCQTEVQGALDVQIMLGSSDTAGDESIRGINIVKNKISGRHPKEVVRLDKNLSIFQDI